MSQTQPLQAQVQTLGLPLTTIGAAPLRALSFFICKMECRKNEKVLYVKVIFKTVPVYASEGLLTLLSCTQVSVIGAEKAQERMAEGPW